MCRTIFRSLSLTAAVLLFGSLPAALQGKSGMVFSLLDGPGPLTLEWSDAEQPTDLWSTVPTADVDVSFMRLRMRGTKQHAGTWCRLRGRVSIAEPFFLLHPEPMYQGLRKTTPVALKSLGFDVNGAMPKSIYPAAELFEFLQQAWPVPALHSNAVLSFCEPILNPGPLVDDAYRVWNGAYSSWSENQLAWWTPILSTPNDTTILNMRALTEALILAQTDGAVGSEFFTSGLAVAAAQLGMVLELQVLSVVGSATEPEEFPQEEGERREPLPGLHGYPAPGVSSLVSYQFTGTGGSHTFPSGEQVTLPIVFVHAGEGVDFRMNGLFNDTFARLRIDGDVASEFWSPLVAGTGIATACFRVPPSLTAGTTVEIVGFRNPFGDTALPSGSAYRFEVL